MTKRITISAFMLVLIGAMLITFMTTYTLMNEHNKESSSAGTSAPQYTEEQQKIIDKFVSVDNLFRSHYIEPLDYDEILDYMMYGYSVGSGDKYATYWNEESYAAYNEDASGGMVGIGVNIVFDSESSLIEIVNIMNNSPALEAGLQVGDLLDTVDGNSVAEIGYEEAVDRMLGEAGTVANFTVLRGEDDSRQQLAFSVTRAEIEEQDVFAHLYASDPTVGVIRVSRFNGKAGEQFIDAIESLRSLGAERFVFDVRDNPGGDLNVICSVLDYLLPEGPIIRVSGTDGTIAQTIVSDADCVNFPVAVLVNDSTASAAELFASALQDYVKAGHMKNITLVGTTTYGKGVMQSIYTLPDGTGVKLSTAMYNPPYSENYDGIGVQPDLTVELDEELKKISIFKFTDENDNQLSAAVAALAS